MTNTNTPDQAASEREKVLNAESKEGEHHWFNYRGTVCCSYCGNVKRADERNSLCKGKAKIVLR